MNTNDVKLLNHSLRYFHVNKPKKLAPIRGIVEQWGKHLTLKKRHFNHLAQNANPITYTAKDSKRTGRLQISIDMPFKEYGTICSLMLMDLAEVSNRRGTANLLNRYHTCENCGSIFLSLRPGNKITTTCSANCREDLEA